MTEILAPCGSFETLLAALRCGADAVFQHRGLSVCEYQPPCPAEPHRQPDQPADPHRQPARKLYFHHAEYRGADRAEPAYRTVPLRSGAVEGVRSPAAAGALYVHQHLLRSGIPVFFRRRADLFLFRLHDRFHVFADDRL